MYDKDELEKALRDMRYAGEQLNKAEKVAAYAEMKLLEKRAEATLAGAGLAKNAELREAKVVNATLVLEWERSEILQRVAEARRLYELATTRLNVMIAYADK